MTSASNKQNTLCCITSLRTRKG